MQGVFVGFFGHSHPFVLRLTNRHFVFVEAVLICPCYVTFIIAFYGSNFGYCFN